MTQVFVALFSVGFLAVMSSDAACVHNVLQFRTVRMNSGNWCVKLNELAFKPFCWLVRVSLLITLGGGGTWYSGKGTIACLGSFMIIRPL